MVVPASVQSIVSVAPLVVPIAYSYFAMFDIVSSLVHVAVSVFVFVVAGTVIIGGVGFAAVLYKWILPARKEKKESTDDLKTKILKNGWPWYSTGIILGIVNIIAWLVAFYVASFNYPLGISGGWLSNIQWVLTGATIEKFIWFGFIVIGIIVGGLIGAVLAGEFKLRAPKDAKILLQQLLGGIIMGIGAIIAAGCNIGNLLSGIPQLSLGSIVASVGIVLGCWIMAYLMFMREKSE